MRTKIRWKTRNIASLRPFPHLMYRYRANLGLYRPQIIPAHEFDVTVSKTPLLDKAPTPDLLRLMPESDLRQVADELRA